MQKTSVNYVDRLLQQKRRILQLKDENLKLYYIQSDDQHQRKKQYQFVENVDR